MTYEQTMYNKILAHSTCLVELDDNDTRPVDEDSDLISAIKIANYGEGENVAIECTKCNEIIIDFNRPAPRVEEMMAWYDKNGWR